MISPLTTLPIISPTHYSNQLPFTLTSPSINTSLPPSLVCLYNDIDLITYLYINIPITITFICLTPL